MADFHSFQPQLTKPCCSLKDVDRIIDECIAKIKHREESRVHQPWYEAVPECIRKKCKSEHPNDVQNCKACACQVVASGQDKRFLDGDGIELQTCLGNAGGKHCRKKKFHIGPFKFVRIPHRYKDCNTECTLYSSK